MSSLFLFENHDCQNDFFNKLISGNGSVDIFEFSRMVEDKMGSYDPEKDLREAFAVFDKNGDGKVSSEEIRGDNNMESTLY